MTGFIRQDMSFQMFSDSLCLLENLGIDKVILIGGEPTIHPLFLDFLALIKDRGMKAFLVTNALMLSDKSVVQKITGVTAVTVSLKAFNRRDYRLLTGANVFDRVRQAVVNIQEIDIPYVVNVTLSEETMRKSDELIKFMRMTGSKFCSLDTGKPVISVDGSTNVEGMGTPRELAGYFMATYRRFKEIPDINCTFKIAIPFCLFPRAFLEEVLADEGAVMTGCQMMTGKGIIIDPMGNIIPCNHLCHLALGNISTIRTKADYVRFRNGKSVREFYTKASCCLSTRCYDCEYWSICGSGCRLYWLLYAENVLQDNFPIERR